MPTEQKYELVRKKGLCFHCLCKGHGIAKCTFRPEQLCNKDGCRSRHHRLVHRKAEDKGLLSIEDYMKVYQEGPPLTAQDYQTLHNCGVSITADRNYRSEELTPEQILLKNRGEEFEQVSIKTLPVFLFAED
jgi:hypothetical protein